jgi:hypothetical protein
LGRLYRGAAKAESQIINRRGTSSLRGAKWERAYARLVRYQGAADALFAQQVNQRFGRLD